MTAYENRWAQRRIGAVSLSIFISGLLLAVFLYLAPWPLASLTDPESSQVQQDEVIFNLGPGESAAQVFYVRRSGFDSLTFWVSGAGHSAHVEVHIQRADMAAAPFHQASYPAPASRSAVRAAFPAQFFPPNQAYRVQITCPVGSCEGLQVFGRSDPDSDPLGWAALSNGASLPADIAYTTTYAYTGRSLLEDGLQVLRRLPQLALALLVLLLPGWALLSLAHSRCSPRLSLPVLIALALGLSLGFIPLTLLWTSTGGLSWSGWTLGAALFAAAGVALVRPIHLSPERPGHLAALAAVFAAALLVRTAMVRSLAGPAWVDSFHHALITRLILDSGALPGTLEPYLSIPPTGYHPGYHASQALFTWLSGLDLPASMLFFGQVLNALVVFPVYALTLELTGSRRSALVASLAAGLLSPMPAYYSSWGRYTHLAGMLILPAFILLARRVYLPGRQPGSRAGWISAFLLAGLAYGGLLLVHYRVAAFAALLAGFDCLFSSARSGRKIALKKFLTRPGPTLSRLLCLALTGLGGLLFASPWIFPALSGTILPQAAWTAPAGEANFPAIPWSLLSSGLGMVVLLMSGLGLAAALARLPGLALTLVGWVASLFLLASLNALGLPGGSLVNMTSVAISLFLPLSLLAGWGVDRGLRLFEYLVRNRPTARLWLGRLWLSAALVLGFLGAQRLIPLLNPSTFLLRQADLAALTWAVEHLPPEARVAVNPFNWGYGVHAPADGGGWLPAVSRLVTLPAPVLAGLEYNPRLLAERQVSEGITRLGSDPEGLAALLRQNNISYVFTGARGGVIAAHHLQSSPAFKLLYAVAGVSIFAVQP